LSTNRSALEDCYPPVVARTIRGGVDVVSVYDDVTREYLCIREEAGIIDGHGFCLLRVTGSDAEAFLDGLATKDVQYLTSGTVSECAFLDEEANLVGLVFVERLDECFVVLSPAETGHAVASWVSARADEWADVVVEDMTDSSGLFFVEGPKSWRLMRDVFALEIESLALRGVEEVQHEGVAMTVSRLGRSGEYGYAVVAPREALATLATQVLGNTSDVAVRFCGSDAMDVCMLEIRQPNLVHETSARGDMLELGQNWLVQYDKETYVGHDVLMAKFGGERVLGAVGFLAAGRRGEIDGATVMLADAVVGHVLYGRYSEKAQGTLGLALVDNQWAVSGIPLAVRAEVGGETWEVQTISCPFVRPVSWDEKME